MIENQPPTGILVLAYGTPEKPEDIAPYYTHIRGGRPPSPESLHNLQERYRLVGGRTPLLDLSRGGADGLPARPGADSPRRHPGDFGMKHWRPFFGGGVSPNLGRGGGGRGR